ncbi:respiratory nitrate reductase subunit gamma [Streptomyces rimosus]|uniref:respiratory nitrate reductase subunit gamma n=1 Tax=Streptomyces rimosus TaxID=1927 RepID=UPI0007C46D66
MLLVAGSVRRHHYDRFGFTTRSSQLHESALLRLGSPLFRYGLLFVIAGHLTGLLIPETFTEYVHVHEWLYHLNALAIGGVAGLVTAAGSAVLVYRRLSVPAVRAAGLRSDRVAHPLFAATLVAGLAATATTTSDHPYDYRQGVSVWFRSLFTLGPDVAAMAHAPFVHRLHTLLGMALFALWPFSRLVHVFTAPVGYLAQPYIVHRSRGRQAAGGGPPVHAGSGRGREKDHNAVRGR